MRKTSIFIVYKYKIMHMEIYMLFYLYVTLDCGYLLILKS